MGGTPFGRIPDLPRNDRCVALADSPQSIGPLAIARPKDSRVSVSANRLRKTEYVLYLSHSRSLTSASLQLAGWPEEEDTKIDFEAFRPQPKTRVEAEENIFYLNRP
jgi:hypothetical protein